MIGDNLVIKEHHIKSAGEVIKIILPEIKDDVRYVITVGGESGSGKSEIGHSIKDLLEKERNIKSIVFQQDDYFIYPPLSNAKKRKEDISWVGMNEVKLELLNQHIKQFKEGATSITKPLVIYQEDKVTEEKAELKGINILIIEGTYTTNLNDVDYKVFIDKSYKETKKSRLERAREEQDNHLEEVLKIEHKIISKQKELADIIINSDYSVKDSRS